MTARRHSRPQRSVIRTLENEIDRALRARVTNPCWQNISPKKLLSNRLGELALPVQQARSVRWCGRYEFILRRLLIPLQNTAQRLGLVA